MSSREQINAALTRAFGAGGHRLQTIATEALRQARVGPWANPRRIAAGLGYATQATTARDAPRAVVDGRHVIFRWHPSDREWGLNLFIGVGMARLGELDMTVGRSEIYGLAGFLALPENRFDTAADIAEQRFLPGWFIVAHQRLRAVGSASGVIRLCLPRVGA